MRLLGAPGFVRFLALAAIAVALVFFVGTLGLRLRHYGSFADSLMDDAFFFVRYAGNFLDSGIFAWNRGEGPVHGNTSQLYQVLVTLLLWLSERNAVLSLSLAATLGALACLVLVPLAWLQSRPAAGPTLRLLVCSLIVVLICFDGQMFLLIGTGMETSWAMALVALSMVAAFRLENGLDGRRGIMFSAACILLVYAMRPDAVLLAMAGPAGVMVFARESGTRRAGLRAGLLGIGLVGAFLLICWLYYGDALPLASFAKTTALSALPEEGRGEAAGFPLSYLWITILLHAPEIVLGLAALFFFPQLSPALRGATLGMIAFTLYHLFLVVPVMGYFGRFNAPALPVLTVLAAQAIEILLVRSRIEQGCPALGLTGATIVAGLALLVGYKVFPTAVRVVYFHPLSVEAPAGIDTKDGAIAAAADALPFFRGFLVRMGEAMGPDCSIASTEDGVLSAYLQANRIVDMSGLHDRDHARRGFSADRLLLQQKPDILAMPHPWYREWIAAIERHPAFARDYILEPRLAVTGEGLAFRRDSACAMRTRQVLYGR